MVTMTSPEDQSMPACRAGVWPKLRRNTTSLTWGSCAASSTSSAKDPSHIYSAHGTYTVSHTAGNACGSDTETKTNLIAVQGPHTPGDVFFTENSPPLEFLQENKMRLDEWDVRLLLKHSRDFDYPIAQPVEARIVTQHRKLEVEHQEVETLRLFVLSLDVRRKRRDFRREVVEIVGAQHVPRVRIGVALDVFALGAHDEVV